MGRTQRRIHFGSFELDEASAELFLNGEKVKLQDQPFQILQILVERPGQLITREELREKVWPNDTFVDFDHGINNAIKRLREGLRDTAETPRYIETVPRHGYRFIGKLEAVQEAVSLAVLPLENLRRDPGQEYFADGLTEALITSLARISALRVTSRTTVMRYKGVRTKSIPEIARDLSVDRIVEGSVLRSGDRVRISVQLIDASTDTHVWAESYERDLRDVLALQAEVARAVADEIRVKVSPQEQVHLTATRRVDPEAYECYLKGRYHLNKRTLESFTKSAEYFEHAIQKDSQYAAPHAGLADTASRLGFYGYVNPAEGCGRGKVAALRAIELDSSSSEGHAALGFCLIHYDCAFAAAEGECRRAVALDPQNPWAALALAICLVVTGRFDEGINETVRLVRLDPVSPARWVASALLYHSRRYDEAIEQAHKCLELDPTFSQPKWTIAVSLAKQQGSETGIPGLEEAVRATSESQFFLGSLGYCYAKAGRRADAMKVRNRMRELSGQRYVSGYWPATICGALGQNDEAFDLLEAAYQERATWMAYTKVAPFFDDLRSDPRFDKLLGQINFPS